MLRKQPDYLAMQMDKNADESPIVFRLDAKSGVPPYLQLVQQVEQALRLGHLRIGDRLPKVKEVVAALAINPNTVLKAYRELEHKGLAVGRPGQGTFVEAALGSVGLREQTALRKRLERWLRDAADAGLDDDAVAALINSTLQQRRSRGVA